MSGEARPISPNRFAKALEDLPVENLYSKAHEIQNSIHHLQRSNAQLQEYSDSIRNDSSIDASVRSEGDKDCLDAISENQAVIDRQLERINLLKQEVERRGGRWHEAELKINGVDNDAADASSSSSQPADPSHRGPAVAGRPRLTDEELRRRLEEQMADDEDGGMHL